MSMGHAGLLGFAGQPEDYPIRATLWAQDNTSVSGPPTHTTSLNVQPYTHYVHWSGTDKAVGNAIEFFFALRAGVYVLSFLGQTLPGGGLVDWYLDGDRVVIAQDWYSAAFTANVTFTREVTLRTSGVHVLYGRVMGKNPLSGDYDMDLTKVWFVLKDEGRSDGISA